MTYRTQPFALPNGQLGRSGDTSLLNFTITRPSPRALLTHYSAREKQEYSQTLTILNLLYEFV